MPHQKTDAGAAIPGIRRRAVGLTPTAPNNNRRQSALQDDTIGGFDLNIAQHGDALELLRVPADATGALPDQAPVRDLTSYHEGRARKVVMSSIEGLIERRIAAASNNNTPRGRGRPRKYAATLGAL